MKQKIRNIRLYRNWHISCNNVKVIEEDAKLMYHLIGYDINQERHDMLEYEVKEYVDIAESHGWAITIHNNYEEAKKSQKFVSSIISLDGLVCA